MNKPEWPEGKLKKDLDNEIPALLGICSIALIVYVIIIGILI